MSNLEQEIEEIIDGFCSQSCYRQAMRRLAAIYKDYVRKRPS